MLYECKKSGELVRMETKDGRALLALLRKFKHKIYRQTLGELSTEKSTDRSGRRSVLSVKWYRETYFVESRRALLALSRLQFDGVLVLTNQPVDNNYARRHQLTSIMRSREMTVNFAIIWVTATSSESGRYECSTTNDLSTPTRVAMC